MTLPSGRAVVKAGLLFTVPSNHGASWSVVWSNGKFACVIQKTLPMAMMLWKIALAVGHSEHCPVSMTMFSMYMTIIMDMAFV